MAHRALSALFLVAFSPVLIAAALAKFFEDGSNPFYVSQRVGLGGRAFSLIKIRTMAVGSHTTGVDTTVAQDPRVTRVGRVLRASKIDELPQLLNVLLGDMRIVGPRPNVPREVAKYTTPEQLLLSVPPGLTDLASIAFFDLAERLSGALDANRAYEVHIRPYKSRLGILYAQHHGWALDAVIVFLTLLNFASRRLSLRALILIVRRLEGKGDRELERVILGRRD